MIKKLIAGIAAILFFCAPIFGTLVDVGGINYPWIQYSSANATFTSCSMTLTADKCAFVFVIPVTGTLRSIGFVTGAVTQSPTGGLKVSFQDLSSGDPDGTADQYRTITPAFSANTWVDVMTATGGGPLTSTGTGAVCDGTNICRSVTAGDVIGIVIEFASFNASDNLNIKAVQNMTASNDTGLVNVYQDRQTSAAWTKLRSVLPDFSLLYDDGNYYSTYGVIPASAITSTAFKNSSTPDEIGAKFTVPVPMRVSGACYLGTSDAGNTTVKLYDGSDGLLASGTFVGTNRTAGAGWYCVIFTAQYTLAISTTYRLTSVPSSATNTGINDITVNAAAILDQMGGGQNWSLTTRADAGAWTDTATRRPFMSLRVVQLDNGVSTAPGGSGRVISQ